MRTITKLFARATKLPFAAIAALLFFAGSTSASADYFNGFETDIDGWFTPTRVATGTDGIPSAAGGWHAEAVAGSFTRWGGYSSVFPAGGFRTSVDVYLDMATTAAHDTRFNFSSAISDPTGAHRRDFVLTGGFYTDTDATGSGARFVFSASNNSPGWPKDPSRSPFAVTATGWITVEHHFYDTGGGVLAVTISLRSPGGTLLTSWTLSDPSDIIGVTVGGNRYGWFVTNGFPFLAIDNSKLELALVVPEMTCTGFQPPMDKIVSIKKKSNRVLPFKMQILNADGVPQSDANIAAPVIQVVFNSETYGGVDGDDLLSSGKGDEGNQFVYDSIAQTWQFNLNSKQFTAPGTYVVTAVSGDSDEYLLNGCEAVFIIE